MQSSYQDENAAPSSSQHPALAAPTGAGALSSVSIPCAATAAAAATTNPDDGNSNCFPQNLVIDHPSEADLLKEINGHTCPPSLLSSEDTSCTEADLLLPFGNDLQDHQEEEEEEGEHEERNEGRNARAAGPTSRRTTLSSENSKGTTPPPVAAEGLDEKTGSPFSSSSSSCFASLPSLTSTFSSSLALINKRRTSKDGHPRLLSPPLDGMTRSALVQSLMVVLRQLEVAVYEREEQASYICSKGMLCFKLQIKTEKKEKQAGEGEEAGGMEEDGGMEEEEEDKNPVLLLKATCYDGASETFQAMCEEVFEQVSAGVRAV